MKYTDFAQAALRHQACCNYILNDFKPKKPQERDQLLWNLYYLSGYILECSLKFAIYDTITPYKRKSDPITFEHTIGGAIYDLKTHRLEVLSRALGAANTSLPRDIPFVTASVADSNHRILIHEWNPEIRYSKDYVAIRFNLTQEIVENYLNRVVNPISTKLTALRS